MEDVAKALVDELYQTVQFPEAGRRINHAKGMLLRGMFTATPQAQQLSKAFHLQGEPVQVIVRFSNSTGMSDIPDNVPQANPRGMAIRFIGSAGQYTDLIGHSVEAFPAGTPNDFLTFLKVVNRSKNGAESMQNYVKDHPAARRFFDMLADKTPQSFATEQFFFLHAFKLSNAEGKSQVVRFIIKPAAGVKHLSTAQASRQSGHYLHDEMVHRLQQQEVKFELFAQISQDPGRENNVAIPWPTTWPLYDLGTLTLNRLLEDPALEKKLLFAPLNLTPGIEAGNDPMLQVRQDAYLKSYQRRQGK